ncbi:hypothetical protein GXB84_06135 [Stenotrophomonas acidaminiphila]|uniref:hypothetical protein n=1 Tax=Stenotrophomonas acidaminiphila TaxID=128780 RepID=UPI00137544E5|nr:hypothetical protein [Stenotrophomonas acidaminiphila]NCT86908.1 hypothetical protein [Stenotrophomonas acidaminiphila]
MASKGWAGALTLALAFQAQAGSGKGLLETLGRALGNTPRAAAEKARSPYLDPAGTYWDLDQDTLEGAQHLRVGLTATASVGSDMCDMKLLAMAHSSYRLDAKDRQWCLYQWWVADTKINGANGIEQTQTDAIERRYGPAFDARLEKFKTTRRFAVRPDFVSWGGVEYNSARGAMEVYVPLPEISTGGLSVTGKGFVPWFQRTDRVVFSPKWAGRYQLLIRMDSAEAANLARQGRDARDDLVVFSVNRVWVENKVPKMDVTVERVRVGYRNETIEVDLTNKQGAGA